MAADTKRGWLSQAWRDVKVATGLRQDSQSALAEDLEDLGFTAEEMVELTPERLRLLNGKAQKGVIKDAREAFITMIKQEFEIEPAAKEVDIFIQLIEARGGIIQRSKKVEKVAAQVQRGIAGRTQSAITDLQQQVSGLAEALAQARQSSGVLETAVVALMQGQGGQNTMLAAIANALASTTPPATPPDATPPATPPAATPAPFAGA